MYIYVCVCVCLCIRISWITTYQFLFSIPLAFPMAAIGDPRVLPGEFFPNLWDGLKCFFGVNTVTEAGKYPDDCRPWAIVFLPLYMIFNIAYSKWSRSTNDLHACVCGCVSIVCLVVLRACMFEWLVFVKSS